VIGTSWMEKDRRALWRRRLEWIAIGESATYDGIVITRLTNVSYRLWISPTCWSEVGDEHWGIERAWEEVVNWLENPVSARQKPRKTFNGELVGKPTSGYYGVHTEKDRYVAKIIVRGENIRIASGKDPVELARRYNEYILEHGLDRPLNDLS
jgi:hypothetical protein